MDNQENQELERQILEQQDREKQNQENQNQEKQKTNLGIEPNIAGLLCYLISVIAGVVFLVIEKENKFIRFHAIQSIILGCGFVAAYFAIIILDAVFENIPILGFFIGLVLGLVYFLLGPAFAIITIIMMIKSYGNETFKLPVIGDIAAKKAGLQE